MGRALKDTASDAGFASLGPTLLARKGGAKPAMRPQLAPLPDASIDAEKLEDLGWNDMGETDERESTAPARPKKAAKSSKRKPARKTSAKASEKTARRAAFTLRLDADRHLKLRLAATMHGVSAQALVTDALDTMFGEISDLDALASRMKRN